MSCRDMCVPLAPARSHYSSWRADQTSLRSQDVLLQSTDIGFACSRRLNEAHPRSPTRARRLRLPRPQRLRALKTDPVFRREWAEGFGELGMADSLYIRYGCGAKRGHAPSDALAGLIWIEWKTPTRRAALHQLA
jgi:hypothetical protein